MSTERRDLARLFDQKHRLRPEDAEALPREDVEQVAAMVRGERKAPDLARALEVLAVVRPAELRTAAQALATDTARPSHERALAVRYLARVAGRGAEERLRALTRDDHPLVRLAAVRELGVVGSKASLPELARSARGADESLRRLAVLSAALVAFREGVAGHEPVLPPRLPPERVRWDVGVRLADGSRDLAQRVAAQLGDRLFGLRPRLEAAKAIECGRVRLVLLPDERVATGDAVPTGDLRRLVAVVAEKAEVEDTYATSHLVLTWPGEGRKQRLGVFRTDGLPVSAGAWHPDGRFELYGVEGGPFTVEITGDARRGVQFERARSGRTAAAKSAPIATGPPG